MRINQDYYNSSLAMPTIGIALGSVLSIAAGSGVTQFSPNELQRVAYTTSVKTLVKPEQSHNVNQEYSRNLLSEQLNFIKSTFALHDDDLAKALGVVRKTLSNWKVQGEITRDKSLERFFVLHALAKDWQQLAYPSTREALLLPIIDGENVLSLLKQETLDVERILYFGRCLTRDLAADVDLY